MNLLNKLSELDKKLLLDMGEAIEAVQQQGSVYAKRVVANVLVSKVQEHYPDGAVPTCPDLSPAEGSTLS